MREVGLDGLLFLLQTAYQRLLPTIPNFLSLSDKELVIVSPVISVHTLRKKGEIKTMPFLTKLHSSLVL